MKVLDIDISTLALAVTPIGNRLYKVAKDTSIYMKTDEGVLKFHVLKGFVTNFRSGGLFVDKFIDQVGDEKKSWCYLIHDMMYTPCSALCNHHPVSKPLADEILYSALVWAEMPKAKAWAVRASVTAFGASAYEEDDALTSCNSKLFTFEWSAK